jgi:polysaccharide export outer membrane protein
MPYSGATSRILSRLVLCLGIWIATGACAFAAVRVGDELQVTIYNSPDLSRKVTVDATGAVSLPLAGTVNVGGLEPSAAAVRIERALDPYFASRAAVSVEMLAQTTSIFVDGGPGGVLKFEPGETLTAALSQLSGADGKSLGLTAIAHSPVDLRRVGVERNGVTLGSFDAISLTALGQGGPVLQPGDTISLVDKPNAVHVLGDVASPGTTYVATDETLNDALAQAGGVRTTAATANLTLERNGVTQTLALGATAMREPAQNGDVLTIQTAPRVSVAGTVNKPGSVALTTNFTLLSAIYEAGGPAKRADLAHVRVMHDGTALTYNVADLATGNFSQNPVLADGDLVFVPEGRNSDFSQLFQILLPLVYLVPRF